MNRQKKQKQRKISSSTGHGRSRPMPTALVQLEINGRPTPEQIAQMKSLGPLGYRSLAAYRMLLRQLMGAALPILQAKIDWRVAADVPSTVWYIAQATTPEFMFMGLRNADGHDIAQVRDKIAPMFPGTIVVRPRAGGEVEFQFRHVGLDGEERYSFKYGPGPESGAWQGLFFPAGVDDIGAVELVPDGMGFERGTLP